VNEGPRPAPAADANSVVDWARALALGIRDTARDMLDAGRDEARDAYNEYWRRYDAKTKLRSERRRRQR